MAECTPSRRDRPRTATTAALSSPSAAAWPATSTTHGHRRQDGGRQAGAGLIGESDFGPESEPHRRQARHQAGRPESGRSWLVSVAAQSVEPQPADQDADLAPDARTGHTTSRVVTCAEGRLAAGAGRSANPRHDKALAKVYLDKVNCHDPQRDHQCARERHLGQARE